MAVIIFDKIRDICLCPHCKKYLFDDEFAYLHTDYKYCPYCGKEIIVRSNEHGSNN